MPAQEQRSAQLDRSETLEGYDLWSQAYDEPGNPWVAMTEWAMERAPLLARGQRILELGCGTGRNAGRALAEGAVAYSGLDGSPGMLERAKAKHPDPRASWILGNLGKRLPFAEGEFDLVLISLVLEHIQGLGPLLGECARVLRPGGRARILEIHPERVLSGTQAHFLHEGREIRFASFPHDAEELRRGLEGAGLTVEKVAEWRASPAVVERIAKLGKHAGLAVLIDVEGVKPSER